MQRILTVLRDGFRFLGSFALAVILIALLFILTLLGTLAQVDSGLHTVQKKYFESLYVVHDLYGIPIPLPGGLLVITVFSINIIVGGLIRIRKKKQTVGVIIAHVGILTMLLGGLVTFAASDSGYMQLYETQASNEFVSYYDWALEIGQPGSNNELFVIPHKDLKKAHRQGQGTFYSDELPFEITVSGFSSNAVPIAVEPSMKGRVRDIGGYYLRSLPPAAEAESNMAGAYAILRDRQTGETQECILWGASTEPATVRWAGVPYTLDLAHARYEVPFAIVLDKFNRELHANTQMAASFESEVTMIEGDTNQATRIYMNHPLRHEGYTLFQASWGPQGGPAMGPLYSVFAVVRNPADQVPLVACIIVSIGLLIHFCQKLYQHIMSENRKRTV